MRIFLDIGWKRVIIVFGVQCQENTKKTKKSYGCDETKSSACTKERGAMVGYPCEKAARADSELLRKNAAC